MKARVVFLEMGTNDINNGASGTDLTTFTDGMFSIVRQILASGSRVVLVGVAPRVSDSFNNSVLRGQYNAALRRIAANYAPDVLFVDMSGELGQRRTTTTGFNRDDILTSLDSGDGVHYTDAGYAIHARKIGDALLI
jgi:lysophospholipase L1-like esterase